MRREISEGRCFADQSRETRIDTLEVPEQFVLWAIRRWADSWRHGDPVEGNLSDGFDAAALGPEARRFADWLGVLAAGARRPLEVRAMTCAHVGSDEATLLDALAAWQRGRADLAAEGLSELASPSAMRMASAHGRAFAEALVRSGLDLPLRDLPARAVAQSMRAAQSGLAALQ